MKIIFLKQALLEFEKAIFYYEEHQPGLGNKFKNEISKHIQWIKINYLIPRLRKNQYKRVNLNIFPFNIIYIIREKTIWIVACQAKP